MFKVVIVTGGSRGIGAEISKLLAKQGYAVCINYRSNGTRADSVLLEILDSGGTACIYQADVSIEEQVIGLFEYVEEKFGKVSHLVNNAGVLFQQTDFCSIDVSRFEAVLKNNVISCFLCSKEMVKRANTGRAIVNVSSVASRTGSPFEYVDYAASKGAIDSLTKGLSVEVAEKGIRVNAVRPGFIFTEMHAAGGEPLNE